MLRLGHVCGELQGISQDLRRLAREGRFGPTRGYNVGGDYHFKRLLRLDWPAGTVTAAEFADEYPPLAPTE